MLSINTKNSFTFSWYVGDCELDLNSELIDFIIADEDELKLIKKECTGIRMNNRSIVTWFGDEAKFILTTIKAIAV